MHLINTKLNLYITEQLYFYFVLIIQRYNIAIFTFTENKREKTSIKK